MPPWLFNVYIDGMLWETDTNLMNRGVNVTLEWNLVVKLFAGDTNLLAESEKQLQRAMKTSYLLTYL